MGSLVDAENGLISRRIFIEPEIYIEEVRFARDSPLEGDGFELVWEFFWQVVFWFVAGSLFGAERPFLVPSPAIRFAERRKGVKGPKC